MSFPFSQSLSIIVKTPESYKEVDWKSYMESQGLRPLDETEYLFTISRVLRGVSSQFSQVSSGF